VTARLTFAPGPHEYRLDGEPVPSVTTVLNSEMPGWQAGEWYLQRGIVVHACAAHIARDQEFALDLSDQTPEDRADIEGRIEACRRFMREIRPEVLCVEHKVGSERHRYAGTLDMLCRIQGTLCVLDWKPSITPATRFQVAAYSLAYGEQERAGKGPSWGLAVALQGNGLYRMSELWDLRRVTAGWLALLGAYRIRRECGIKQEDGDE